MTNEKAIKILDNMPIPSHYFILDKEPITFEEMAEAIEMAIEALKNERPQGEWIEHQDCYDDTYYTCSHCGEDWITIEGKPTDNLMNYCPMCGADMREAEK